MLKHQTFITKFIKLDLKNRVFILSVVLISFVLLFSSSQVNAVISFNKNMLISNPLFTDVNSMSIIDIQAFLETNNSMLANWIDSVDMRRPSDNCIVHNATGMTAAEIIYEASTTWGAQVYDGAGCAIPNTYWSDASYSNYTLETVSPKVLLVMLQKEQSLISATGTYSTDPNDYKNPSVISSNEYKLARALGYAVPDTGSINDKYLGFYNQINWASWQLRFNYERSIGNTAWDLVDYITYSGPMIEGTYQRCGSCTAETFDGFYPIDGSPLHMDNRATAALYYYTPHTYPGFFGNYNFVQFYTDWFGSTIIPQPTGANFIRQSSNGNLYLTISTTRYYIPSMSILKAYGLETYPPAPASDSNIASFLDGGNLSNLIRVGTDIYLIDDSTMHYIPSSQICTDWGLDCFNTNVTKTLDGFFVSVNLHMGAALTKTVRSNGNYYLMSAGTKQPFADLSSFLYSGYTESSAITVSDYTLNQPLGKLIISTPSIIGFYPKKTLYYFNGTDYYLIPDMDIFNDWNLFTINRITPPMSSYNLNNDPQIISTIGLFASTVSGTKYAVNFGTKIDVTSNSPLFPGVNYLSGLDLILNKLTSKAIQPFIYVSGSIYLLSNNSKNYISSMSYLKPLGASSTNIITLAQRLAGFIPEGPIALPSGTLLRLNGGANIYVVQNESLYKIPDMSTFYAYSIKTPIIDLSNTNRGYGYPINGSLSNSIIQSLGGDRLIYYKGMLLSINKTLATDFGLNSTSFTLLDAITTKNSIILPMTKFLRNDTSGAIYYASGGLLHYVTSYAALYDYGGNTTPITPVDSTVLSLFTKGQPI